MSVPVEDDVETELLLVLRAHADEARHGRQITGIAVGVNAGDVAVLVLRHP